MRSRVSALSRANRRRAAHRGCRFAWHRPPRFTDLFESFLNVIPFQQLSLEAGVSIVGRLIQRFGRPVRARPQAVPRIGRRARAIAAARLQHLRACGLSRGKAETLRNLARIIEARELREEEYPECRRGRLSMR